jgi:hypothetical protein
MTEFAVFVAILAGCSLGAGAFMVRRSEPFALWAALGLGLGPFVIPYARQYLADRPAPRRARGAKRDLRRRRNANRSRRRRREAALFLPGGLVHRPEPRLLLVPAPVRRLPVNEPRVPARRRGCSW